MNSTLRLAPAAASVHVVNDSPDTIDDPAGSPTAVEESPGRARADLDQVERDLAGVESALDRLDAGTYWTDEVTGEPIPDDVLIANPVTRRTQ